MQLRSNFNSIIRYPTRLSISKNDVRLNCFSELLGIAQCDNRVNDEEYSFHSMIESRCNKVGHIRDDDFAKLRGFT